MMKVLVYGSGGRDHCLADSYANSQHVDQVYITPGNPGIGYTPKGQRGLIQIVRLDDFKNLVDLMGKRRMRNSYSQLMPGKTGGDGPDFYSRESRLKNFIMSFLDIKYLRDSFQEKPRLIVFQL